MKRLFTALIALSWGCSLAVAQVANLYGPSISTTLRPDYSTSRWYLPIGVIVANSVGVAPTASVIRCAPGSVGQKLTITNIGVNITTLSAGGFIQVAIYASANGLPGALIGAMNGGVGTGISTAATGFVSAALTAAKQVGPSGANGDQALWWCSNQDNAVALTASNSVIPSINQSLVGASAGANSYSATASTAGVTCSGANCNGGSSTFGTWPASLAGSTWTDATTRIIPAPSFQPSSIP